MNHRSLRQKPDASTNRSWCEVDVQSRVAETLVAWIREVSNDEGHSLRTISAKVVIIIFVGILGLGCYLFIMTLILDHYQPF